MMDFDRVKVARTENGKLSLVDKGVLCIEGSGQDLRLVLVKPDSLMDVAGLKVKSVRAALREDPADAIKAGASALGVAAGKMVAGAVTGRNYRFIRYQNPYAKDFGKEIQRQEQKFKSAPVPLWFQRVDELTSVQLRENVICLTTKGDQQYSVIFPRGTWPAAVMERISDARQTAQEEL